MTDSGGDVGDIFEGASLLPYREVASMLKSERKREGSPPPCLALKSDLLGLES